MRDKHMHFMICSMFHSFARNMLGIKCIRMHALYTYRVLMKLSSNNSTLQAFHALIAIALITCTGEGVVWIAITCIAVFNHIPYLPVKLLQHTYTHNFVR